MYLSSLAALCEQPARKQQRSTQDRFRLRPLNRECGEFLCIINEGPSNLPTSGANKVEAGFCQQKSGITTTEAA